MDETDNSVLPPLRQDLEILPGASYWTGAPSWLIHDKMRNCYFRVGCDALDLLANWRSVSAQKLAQIVSGASRSTVSRDDVEEFAKFLISNSLVISQEPDAWREHMARYQAGKKVLWKSVIHNYLFFKLPLFRPQKFLDAVWPLIAPLFTRQAAIMFLLVALFSLHLVSRQWSEFTSTLMSFLTIEGMLLYGASLIFIKIIHELGHAFMARKYQCDVAVIGIAFIVMMPILYTDTTSAHRLQNRAKRLNIDLAGIYAELALASIATLLWVFLPDGPLRSVAFSTATLSWVLSLAVNLNPFMRFDGYYVLSDLTGFENLQERGFAMAKWGLREMLFSLKAPPPELLPRQWILPIILHAWGTWIYRFFLFLGIAILVYAFFIKIVGIVLFIVEICWFIALPVAREVSAWWQLRGSIAGSRRSFATLGLLLAFLVLIFTPWSTGISMPAIAKTGGVITIHAADEGKVLFHSLLEGRRVKKGELLVSLSSPDLDEKIARNRAETSLLKKRLARMTADAEDHSLRLVLEQEFRSKLKEADGLALLKGRLEIKAPVSGILVNVDRDLHTAMWLNPRTLLTRIRPDNALVITALAGETGAARISQMSEGKFIPENLQLPAIEVVVRQVGEVPLHLIEEPLFADIYGGHISVRPARDEEGLLPTKTWFPVRLQAANSNAGTDYNAQVKTVQRGIVVVDGEAQSYASRIGRRVASVLLREAGL